MMRKDFIKPLNPSSKPPNPRHGVPETSFDLSRACEPVRPLCRRFRKRGFATSVGKTQTTP